MVFVFACAPAFLLLTQSLMYRVLLNWNRYGQGPADISR